MEGFRKEKSEYKAVEVGESIFHCIPDRGVGGGGVEGRRAPLKIKAVKISLDVLQELMESHIQAFRRETAESDLHLGSVLWLWQFVCCLVPKLCLTLLCLHGLQPTRLLCPWDFPDKNIRVSCHFLFQRIFPTQGSNPRLLHQQADSLPLSHYNNWRRK